jgi:hypothetical protein
MQSTAFLIQLVTGRNRTSCMVVCQWQLAKNGFATSALPLTHRQSFHATRAATPSGLIQDSHHCPTWSMTVCSQALMLRSTLRLPILARLSHACTLLRVNPHKMALDTMAVGTIAMASPSAP